MYTRSGQKGTGERPAHKRLRVHVLRVAVAEGPVLPRNFDEIDDEILRTKARRIREDFGHALEKLALLLRLAAGAHGDLNEDDAVGALDTKIAWVVEQILRGILVDCLEAIIGRNGERFDHGTMNAAGDGLAIRRGRTLAKRNADERHGGSPCVSMVDVLAP